MLGRRATTSAERGDAFCDIRLAHFREFLRAHGIVHIAVRKTRVRLDEDGHAAHRKQPLYEGEYLVGPEGAVDADDVGISGRRDAETLHTAPRERPAALVEGHGTHHGKGAVLAGGESRRLELGKVGHGLDDDDVGISSRLDLLLEDVVRLFEREVAEGLGECTRGPEIERYVCPVPRSLAREFHARRRKTCRLSLRGMFAAVRAESVGEDDVRAAREVSSVHGKHPLGRREIEAFGRDACGQSRPLQLRPEASVKQEETLLCECEKVFHCSSLSPRTPMTAVTVFCGVMR